MRKIEWKFIGLALLTAMGVLWAVVIAPYFTQKNQAPLLTVIAVVVILLVRGKPGLADFGVLAVVGALLATGAASIELHRSWVWVVGISGGLTGMLAMQRITRKLGAGAVLIALVMVGFFLQVVYTVPAADWFRNWREIAPGLTTPPVPLRLESGNTKVVTLIPLFFLELGAFFAVKRLWARMLILLGMLWTLVLIYLCSSRGGMIGMAAGGVGFVILERRMIWAWLRPAWSWLMKRKVLLAVAGVGAAGAALGGLVFMYRAIQAHPTHGAFNLASRLWFWGPGWQGFLQSPVWGNGINTFEHFYLPTISAPPDAIFTYAHNMYIDILLGMGVIGALAVTLLIYALWSGLSRGRKAAVEREAGGAVTPTAGAVIGMAGLPILIAILVHSVFDSYLWHPSPAAMLMVIFGAGLAADPQRLKVRFPAAQVAVVLTVLAAWGLYYVQAPYIQAIRGSGGERDWPVTAAGLDEAVRRLPVSPLMNREDGFAHAQLAAAGVPGELDRAMAAFSAAAMHDQNFSMNYFNLGVLRRAAGDPAGARSALETAIEKAPRWGLAWLNRGVVCEETGDTACARESYAQALRLAPGWVSDPFWQETELRAGIAAAVSVPAVEVLSMDAAMRQSYTRPVLELAKVKIAAGELADAEKLLKLAPMLFMLYEDDVSDLTWLKAELAAAQGNRAEAVKLGTDARKEYVTFRSNDIMATGIYVYGPWIYLLQTTGEDLVPQAVWMEYPGDWSARMEQLKAWQE